MQITKLRLSGFKSFGQPTELAIEPGLTGIVGPNGCGKSNLMDALRWVMGETSARGLRGGEMDDVIFAGTASRPAFDLAEVGLHMRGAPVTIPGLDEIEEIELSRRIGRGTGSVYRVNGKELRARDVQLLFADSASGARSASLVSQGRIGALVDAKPQERRRLLEDAAGIGGLQARRHEAELKLQAAEANLVRVRDTLVTLGEQHKALRKQARDAVRYRELSAAFRETEAALLFGRRQLAWLELEAAEAALRAGRSDVEARSSRLDQARAARDRAAAELATLREREALLAAEHARLDERRRAADDEASRLEADRTRLADQERQLIRDLADAEAALDDARASHTRLGDEQRALVAAEDETRAACERASAAEAAAAEAVRAAENELRDALAAVAALDARLEQLRQASQEIVDQRHAVETAAAEGQADLAALDAFETPTSAAAPPVAELEADARAAAEAAAAAESAVDEATHRLQASRAAVAEAAAAAAARREELRRAQEQLQQAAAQVAARNERLQEMERRRDRLAARSAEITAAIESSDRRRHELDLAGQQAAHQAAEDRLAAAEATLATARDDVAAAEAARDEARTVERNVRDALHRLETEAEALAALAGDDAEGGVIDRIEVTQGYTDALAAALGDDLLGGLDPSSSSHWRVDLGAAAADAPLLPERCPSLADFVHGPRALARRLAQIGVVEAARAPELQTKLAQGQRLVSRDGGLWRWDGFVRQPDPERGAAARLRQRTRLSELDRELAAASKKQDEAATLVASAETRAAEAGEVRRHAEERWEEARAALEHARIAVLEADARDRALIAEVTALEQERTQLTTEQAELDADRAALGSRDDDPDTGLGAEIAALTATVEQATARHDDMVEAECAAEAALTEARAALAGAREHAATARAELDRRYQTDRAAAAEAQEHQRRHAQLEARLVRIAEDRAALDRRQTATEQARAAAERDSAALRTRLAGAEEVLAATRQRHADARMDASRAEDRRSADAARAAALIAEIATWAERATAAETRLAELARRRIELTAALEALAAAPEALDRQRAELEARIEALDAQRCEVDAALAAADAAAGAAQAALDDAEAERVTAHADRARREARLERAQAEYEQAEAALRARLGEVPEAPDGEPPSPEEPTAEVLAELEARLAKVGAARERLGAVNLRAIDEAEEMSLRIQDLEAEEAELTGAIERLRRAISTLNREGRERLRAAFAKVEEHFEALFARMFGGGRARLALTDLDDPLAAGLELAASPPGKKLQSISLLSGGEKALTTLALIFAVFLTQPSPLCVLDEVDAPLDDANVERLLNLLSELAAATDTRFVMITHHPLTMARMDRLYGVTMAERGLSQLVSVDLRAAVELRATA